MKKKREGSRYSNINNNNNNNNINNNSNNNNNGNDDNKGNRNNRNGEVKTSDDAMSSLMTTRAGNPLEKKNSR